MSITQRASVKAKGFEGDVAPTCSVCGNGGCKTWKEKQGYQFFECRSCAHVQLFPIPEAEILDEVYQSGFGASQHVRTDEHFKHFAAEATGDFPLEIIQQLDLSLETRILDIGCSFAYNLNAIRAKGYHHVYGVELSKDAVQVAGECFEIEVKQSVLDWLEDGVQFDFVYLKHNLEHHRYPSEVIHQAFQVLSSGGYLLVGIPNRKSLNALWGSRWEWLTPPIHIHFFSSQSLTKLIQGAGFQLLWLSSRRGHAMPFLKHALYYTPGLSRLSHRFLGDPNETVSSRSKAIRRFIEWAGEGVSKISSPLWSPIETQFLIGEEIWILAKKP